MTEIKQILKKTWAFLKEDSWKSLFVNLLLAFIIIKFIFFPTLSFLTGASMPLVIVESCSMYHPQDFKEVFSRDGVCINGETEIKVIDKQYQLINQTVKFEFNSLGFVRNFNGVLQEININQVEAGDYILYAQNNNQYRQEIISIVGNTYKTKGDYPCKTSDLYSEFGLSLNNTESWPFQNGINKGDIIFVVSPENVKVGNVVIFFANTQYPIIHRIVRLQDTLTTKGDNNPGLLETEKNIDKSKLMGKAVFRIPYLGWIKLIFVDFLKDSTERGPCK